MIEFDSWLKKYRIFSRLMVIIGVVMIWRLQEWGMEFAISSVKSGAEVAAILAAVQVPATFYAGWAFKIYAENKLP